VYERPLQANSVRTSVESTLCTRRSQKQTAKVYKEEKRSYINDGDDVYLPEIKMAKRSKKYLSTKLSIVKQSFRNISLDNLHSSDDDSVHTLESSTSIIDNTGKDHSLHSTPYQLQDKQAIKYVQRDDIESFNADDPYELYHKLEETFSSSDGTTASTESNDIYNAYLLGVRHSSISKSSSGEQLKNSFDLENASMTAQSGDDNVWFGNCFCINMFERIEDDSDIDDDGKSMSADMKRKIRKRNMDATTKGKLLRKARLKAKLALMDPKAARAFKKKLLQEKLSKHKKGNEKNNVSNDLLKIQSEHVVQQMLKKKLKASQRSDNHRRKERKDRRA